VITVQNYFVFSKIILESLTIEKELTKWIFLKRIAKIRGLYNSCQIFVGYLLTKIFKICGRNCERSLLQKAGAKISNILIVNKLICTISDKKM